MGVLIDKIKVAHSFLCQNSSQKATNAEINAFWTIFEEWMSTEPNSPKDLACVKEIRKERVFKRDLLIAYHMLQKDTPMRDALQIRIEKCSVNQEEWEEAAYTAMEIIVKMDEDKVSRRK